MDSLKLKLSTEQSDTSRVNILNEIAQELRRGNPVKAMEFAQQAVELSQKISFAKGEILGLRNLGIAQGFNDDYTAIETLKKSSDLAEKANDLKSLASNSSLIAGAYFNKADMQNAMEYYMKAMHVSESIKDRRGIAIGLAGIANVYSKEGDYKQALGNLFKSMAYLEEIKDQREIARTHLNLGTTYSAMTDWENSIKHFDQAIALYEANKNIRGVAFTLSEIGEVHFRKKQFNKALEFIYKALKLHEDGGWSIELANDYKRLGKVYHELEQDEMAIQNFQKAIPYAEKMKLLDVLSDVYHDLAHIYKEKNDYKNAFTYHEKHVAYYDSIFNNQRNKQIAELQARFEAEARQKEIEILKRDKLIDRIYLIGGGASLIALAIISALIINRQRLRAKKDFEISKRELQIMEEHRALVEAELQTKRLFAEQLENELEHKNKELTAFTLNLIQKNEILEDLKSRVAEIRNNADDATKSSLSSLLSTVNMSFRMDRDWDTFKLHFQQVHKDFFERLTKAFPDLSSNDLKICALLKLNLGTKEMASILDISSESVKAARYRIRKKLGASSDQNLGTFLSVFSEDARTV
ncbi:hypothetical protein WSM22_11810 [Cytophagales bacterium WSM2-2]|nr:hypothetical protein WSM22_11810 [Cytophagales bacterium WSM2-2]